MSTTSTTADGKSRIEPANPMDDPRVTVSAEPGDASRSTEDAFHDRHQYSESEYFIRKATATAVVDHQVASDDYDAVELAKARTRYAGPRTSFRVKDIATTPITKRRWQRRWKLQHDVGPDYTDVDRRKTHLRWDDRSRRCDIIYQRIEIPESAQERAKTKVLTTPLQGFNSHYGGVDGAALGFAMLELADDADEFLSSLWWRRFESQVGEIGFNNDIDSLANYVFDKYGRPDR